MIDVYITVRALGGHLRVGSDSLIKMKVPTNQIKRRMLIYNCEKKNSTPTAKNTLNSKVKESYCEL